MDLALLVYGISLLHGISAFFVSAIVICGVGNVFFFMWYVTETDRKSYYSQKENDEREANGKMCIKWIKRLLATAAIASFLLIFVPTEKTAYTMVGAYAAQKVAENEKVQQMSGKVLTIIEQKLDSYIDQGIKEAEDKVKTVKKK
jgi:TRAP-type C4-dicarboxylate transport system permease large subunit